MSDFLFLLIFAAMGVGFVLSEMRNQEGNPDQSHSQGDGGSAKGQPTVPKWM